jgi:hypothetical protein
MIWLDLISFILLALGLAEALRCSAARQEGEGGRYKTRDEAL